MTDEQSPAAEKKRVSWRLHLMWGGALALLLLLGLVAWTVAVPFLQTRAAVEKLAARKYGGYAEEQRRLAAHLRRLGGPAEAAERLRVYLHAPELIAPRKPAAVYLLGCCGPEAVKTLIEALGDEKLRGPAALALGNAGPDAGEAAPALVRALAEAGGTQDAASIHAGLAGIGRPAVPAMIAALDDPGYGQKWAILRALAVLGPEASAAAPALAGLLEDEPDAATRSAAADALGAMGPAAAEAVPALTRSLGDPDDDVRFAAAQALGLVGKAARSALGELRKLERSEPDFCVSNAAGLAALRIRGEIDEGLHAGSAFRPGYMFWAPAMPILGRDWLVVAGGTVTRTWEELDEQIDCVHARGVLRIEKVYLVREDRPEVRKQWGQGRTTLESAGFDGLKPGDKVIVFVSGYDGGCAIHPALESNCRIGIKVGSWKDPIVAAVRAACGSKDIREVLKQKKHLEAWRFFDRSGAEAALRGRSYLEIMEDEAGK